MRGRGRPRKGQVKKFQTFLSKEKTKKPLQKNQKREWAGSKRKKFDYRKAVRK